MAEFGAGDVADKFRGMLVGQMALTAANALFERPGPVAFHEQSFVMITFYNERMTLAQTLPDQGGGHSHIGHDADTRSVGMDNKTDRIIAIVGHGKGFDGQIIDQERGACHKAVPLQRSHTRITFDPVNGPAVGI